MDNLIKKPDITELYIKHKELGMLLKRYEILNKEYINIVYNKKSSRQDIDNLNAEKIQKDKEQELVIELNILSGTLNEVRLKAPDEMPSTRLHKRVIAYKSIKEYNKSINLMRI